MNTKAECLLRLASSPVASVRLVLWTTRSARRLASLLPDRGFEALDEVLPPPPGGHRLVVRATLKLARASCMVRAGVLQRWDAERGEARSIVIGVQRGAGGGLKAHAWLAGETVSPEYEEISRRPPPVAGRTSVIEAERAPHAT